MKALPAVRCCLLTPTYLYTTGSPWALEVKPDVGHAAHSAVGALPSQLTAGQAQAVTVTARDAAGNATTGGDRVELMLDSVAEGGIRLVVSKWSSFCLFLFVS